MRRKRDTALTVFAVLFGLLAVSNLLKPFQVGGGETGFVLFGKRLAGTANAIVGPLFGVYLAIYAAGIWGMRRYAFPMAWAYAAYVAINLTLFSLRNTAPPGIGYAIFGIVYSAVALGVSVGAAWLLTRRRAALA
jgi:hypothetical protein